MDMLPAMTVGELVQGLALGGAMVLGSWTGRKLIGGMPDRVFSVLVEILLVVSAVALIFGAS
jgi:uncharacterized membrane protein YfcA